jgi:hypothetical protein
MDNQVHPVFVGGTGRSGTSILGRMLGRHSEIYSFPKELRFITDPDGLISLKSALVDNWSFFQSDIAMERFMLLMETIKGKSFNKYPFLSLSEFAGDDYVDEWLELFTDEFVEFKFKSNWIARTNFVRKVTSKLFNNNWFAQLLWERSFYCPNLTEEEFFEKMNKIVSELFRKVLENKNKMYVLDHTPFNLIHADFLLDLFPNMKLIHIHRDPRDVISSYSKMEWGSEERSQNYVWISDTFKRWEEIKKDLPQSTYYELSFEEMIHDPKGQFQGICSFLNVNYEKNIHSIDLSSHNIGRWKNSVDKDLINKITNDKVLNKYIYSK